MSKFCKLSTAVIAAGLLFSCNLDAGMETSYKQISLMPKYSDKDYYTEIFFDGKVVYLSPLDLEVMGEK